MGSGSSSTRAGRGGRASEEDGECSQGSLEGESRVVRNPGSSAITCLIMKLHSKSACGTSFRCYLRKKSSRLIGISGRPASAKLASSQTIFTPSDGL